MPRTSLPWLILATVVVSGALAWWTLTRSIGEPPPARVTHEDLAPFHEIEVGGTAAVTLLQSDAESIDVETSGRATRVDADVTAGRLVIRARDRRRWWSGLFGHRKPATAHVIVRFRKLDALALTGNVKLDAPRLATSSLRIVASGGTSLTIGDLHATSLRVDGSGALNARLAGSVADERVSISGAGSYTAEHLAATHAHVSVSGVGKVLLHAERTLDARISGAGVIEYVGNPAVTEHVSGIGRVRRRESDASSGTRATAEPDQWRGVPDDAPSSLKNSDVPVTGSMSALTPGTIRTSATRQSRSNASSIVATSWTVSYG
jgi:hypothetical protein